MANWTEDEFMRHSVLIVFAWLVVMLVAGLLLIRYASVFQQALA